MRKKRTKPYKRVKYKSAKYAVKSGVLGRISKKKGLTQPLDKKRKRLIFMVHISTALFVSSLAFAIATIVVFTYFSKDLPSPDTLTQREMILSTKIFDKNGELLYDIFDTKDRTLVSLDDISPYLIDATLAVEDADFYKHRGFDITGYVRAVFNTMRGRGLQGASTLSQQLVKNALLSPERTITRKIKEFVLTLQIEKRYSKDEILQMYLNESPYGSTAWGVEAASRLFFGKSAKDLSLAEAAVIAGLPQSPTLYSPITNPDAAKNRQLYVLRLMKDRGWLKDDGSRGYISQEDYDTAVSEELDFSKRGSTFKAPHFVTYVRKLLVDMFGEKLVDSGGLQVTTTLDYGLQKSAQETVTDQVEKSGYLKVGNAALIALDTKTGAIRSMVGSKDFYADDYDGQVNVTLAHRQPGSAIKPITYATGFKAGYTASTVLFDVETEFDGGVNEPKYIPHNYDDKFRGPIQVRYALAQSVNVPAVKMLRLVGIKAMIQTANDLGINSLQYDPSRYGLALTLGGGEVTLLELSGAFAAFGNKGVYNPPYAIEKVEDQHGTILFSHQPESRKAVDEGVAFLISSILSDNQARAPVFGYNSMLNIPGHTVAVKTGTTNDIRDNWTVGYTPSITMGVWAGNNDNSPMHPTLSSGVTGAAPIWNKVISNYLSKLPDEKFEKPKNIVQIQVGKLTGMKPISAVEESRTEYFIKGTEPRAYSNWVRELEICEEDGKLANDDCRDDDKTDYRTFIKFTAHLEEWQDAVDSWVEDHYDKDDEEESRYFPPDEESDYKSEED